MSTVYLGSFFIHFCVLVHHYPTFFLVVYRIFVASGVSLASHWMVAGIGTCFSSCYRYGYGLHHLAWFIILGDSSY